MAYLDMNRPTIFLNTQKPKAGMVYFGSGENPHFFVEKGIAYVCFLVYYEVNIVKIKKGNMKYTERDFKHWKSYEVVRQSGQYNMVLECAEASKKAGLSLNVYSKVCRHYSAIKSAIEEKYGSVENFMSK